MKTLGAVCVVIGCAIVSVVSAQSSPAPQHKATIDQYCVTCHNQRLKTGGLALDALDIANLQTNAETWENAVRKLRVGAMPPHGVRRPDQKTRSTPA
jgi:mono/diheme cytochrome c family protein